MDENDDRRLTWLRSSMMQAIFLAAWSKLGAYLYPWDECNPSRQVPAIVFHATDDPIVPFLGGPSRAFDMPFPVIP